MNDKLKFMKNIERKHWIGLSVAFLFFTLLWTCSCSAQNELFRPDNGKMITWVSEDYIYTGTYADPKKDSIPNCWDAKYCVGDIVWKY